MAFQTPITIREAVGNVKRNRYLLPAIQREFVWKPEQIIRLFDSLLKEYPIGSFLFWDVASENVDKYQMYEFLKDYHERDRRHNEKASLIGGEDIIAVLDGQQRLTSLYIALLGSYAEKKRYYRWTSDHAFPIRRLYLNLTEPSQDFDLDYDFDFLEESDPLVTNEHGVWVKVGRILKFSDVGDVIDFLRDADLLAERYPQKALTALHEAVNTRGTISAYMERDQDLDKVLNIFIRVNSAGTVLSYSDLLLSIATAQWKSLDAREEIYGFVEEINHIGRGFSFSKDFVLKTCLMLADLDTRWIVSNFTAYNMQKIEHRWEKIRDAIRLTVRLVDSFGFSGDNLPSVNAVIPIAYFFASIDNPQNYVDSSKFEANRRIMRRWLNVALLKRIFTGQPDSILRVCRETIKNQDGNEFPHEAIASALKATPKSMRFDAEELDALLDNKYGKSYTYVVLALLYPWLDFGNKLHQDHIHPKSVFRKPTLVKYGFDDPEVVERLKDQCDQLPNLQLLQGLPNTEKSDKPFFQWLEERFTEPAERRHYLKQHYIPEEVDLTLDSFPNFFEARRRLMLEALKETVGWDRSS